VLCLQDDPAQQPACSTIDVPVSENVNEIVVFQAERHVTQSNYTLTLRGFNAPVTQCVSDCGDGVVTPDETCDNGEDNGTGYGQCLADLCIPGERCGDGLVNGPEECDNGINLDGYADDDDDCAPGCVRPSSCGDGVVDSRFGEQCDDGTEANDGSYGGCTPDCQLAPRCGDGTVDDPDESCDDANRINNDGCNVNCQTERIPA
jgi:cysteine-rich repeat protein